MKCYIYHLYNKKNKMHVLFYFIINLILMLVVYFILFYFDEVEPLFADDKLDSVEKNLINEVMVIEDYIVFEQIRKLVLRVFIAYHNKRMINSQYFLDKSSKIRKNKNIIIFQIFDKTWYEPSKLVSSSWRNPSRYFILSALGPRLFNFVYNIIYCLIKNMKRFLLFFWSLNTWMKYMIFYKKCFI